MIFIYCQQFITIPFDLIKNNLNKIPGFKPSIIWKWYRNILDLNCLADVVMNFFTGYYDFANRKVILDPYSVTLYVKFECALFVLYYIFFSHYLKTFFIIDLISSIPTYIQLIIPFISGHVDLYILISLYVKHLKFIRIYTLRNLQFHCAQV